MNNDTVLNEINELVERAKVARDEYLKLNQEQIDNIVKSSASLPPLVINISSFSKLIL